jgi:ABC-type phosphate transport system substrate-binding protein
MKTAIAFLAAMALAVSARAGTGYVVVAHPSVKPAALTKSAVTAIFMKRTLKWQDGTSISALDQSANSAARASFSTDVLGRSVAAVKSYWNQQIFSGRDVPLVEKISDAEVLAYVRATPGAIGYVSETAETSGVKVITIE